MICFAEIEILVYLAIGQYPPPRDFTLNVLISWFLKKILIKVPLGWPGCWQFWTIKGNFGLIRLFWHFIDIFGHSSTYFVIFQHNWILSTVQKCYVQKCLKYVQKCWHLILGKGPFFCNNSLEKNVMFGPTLWDFCWAWAGS